MARKISEILFVLLLLGLYSCNASTEIQSRTYQHTTDNGQTITCNKCQPGNYLLDNCDANGGDAVCEPCKDGTFNPSYSIALSCAPCSTQCLSQKREEIAKNCTPLSNISCQCREGYYREPFKFGLCLFINPCPPGKGVLKLGNGLADTVCEACTKGFFSGNKSKTEQCMPCSFCPADTVQYQDCRRDADRLCRAPGADEFPVGAIIGIAVGGILLVAAVIFLVCCLCVKKKWCAVVRKKICKCCYSPFAKCTGKDLTSGSGGTDLESVKLTMPNGGSHPPPDLIEHLGNGQYPGMALSGQSPNSLNNVFFQLREDLISPEYPQYFRYLFTDYTGNPIEEIKLNYQSTHGVKEVIYQLLVRWQDIEKDNATPEKILTALEDWGRHDLYLKYRDIFRQSNSQKDSLKEKEDNVSKRGSTVTEV